MKSILIALCLVSILCAGCDPAQGFVDVHATLSPLVAEVHVLETVVFRTETSQTTPTIPVGPTETPPAVSSTPTQTAAPSFTPTVLPAVTPTSTKTGTPTLTPTRTGSATIVLPTMTPVGNLLSITASAEIVQPSTRVSFTINWKGPAAEIGITLPNYACCPIPDGLSWLVDGNAIRTVSILIQSNAAGQKNFLAWAKIGGVVVKEATVTVWVSDSVATGTPTPLFSYTFGTPEPTATIRPSLVIPAETWYKLVNNGRFPSLWLYVLNPGDGGFWIYGEDNKPIVNQPLDWYGWHRVDVSGRRADGSGCDPCWLYSSQQMELLEVRWRMAP